MLVTTLDAKGQLEAEGLHVSRNDTHSLWIAGNVRDVGNGVRLSNDACSLMWKSGLWVAVFPSEGRLTYEVPGSLPELVSLITSVYAQYRQAGGSFEVAFPRVVSEAEQYLVDGSPAHST
jgi:hypothetical protein